MLKITDAAFVEDHSLHGKFIEIVRPDLRFGRYGKQERNYEKRYPFRTHLTTPLLRCDGLPVRWVSNFTIILRAELRAASGPGCGSSPPTPRYSRAGL